MKMKWFKHDDNWQETKNATMNTISKELEEYRSDNL